jgi:quercetin dioxygenase-like cupin family protein
MLQSRPMRRVSFSFLSTSLLIPLLAAQTTRELDISAEPSHHLELADIGSEQVFRVEVAPHASTLLHRHRHDYVFISLGTGHVLDEVEGKPPVELRMKDGETRFSTGNFAHVVKNLSDQPFRNVTIELLKDGKTGQTPYRPMKNGEQNFPGGRVKPLFVRDGVRVSEVDLEPGASVPDHHYDGRHLVVAISDCDLRSDIEGWDPMHEKFTVGDAKWLPGGYTNTGRQAARFVTLGF